MICVTVRGPRYALRDQFILNGDIASSSTRRPSWPPKLPRTNGEPGSLENSKRAVISTLRANGYSINQIAEIHVYNWPLIGVHFCEVRLHNLSPVQRGGKQAS